MTKDVTARDLEVVGCSLISSLAQAGFAAGANADAPMRFARIGLGERLGECPNFNAMDLDMRTSVSEVLQRGANEISVIALDPRRRKDYGAMLRKTVRDLPLHSAPMLLTLLTLLEVDGHDMTAVRGEVEALMQLVSSAFGW